MKLSQYQLKESSLQSAFTPGLQFAVRSLCFQTAASEYE